MFLTYLGRQIVLETLYALTSNTKLVKEAMAKGKCDFMFYFFKMASYLWEFLAHGYSC